MSSQPDDAGNEQMPATTRFGAVADDAPGRLWHELASEGCASTPQIFGQMVSAAGLEAIVYRSHLTDGECAAVFPRNFARSQSYMELDDPVPHPGVPKRVDASNWPACERTFEDLSRCSM